MMRRTANNELIDRIVAFLHTHDLDPSPDHLLIARSYAIGDDPALAEAISKYHMRVPTRELNKLIADAQASHPGREARVLYATQGATDPPWRASTIKNNRRKPVAIIPMRKRNARFQRCAEYN